jgi:plasmid stability protein
MNLTVYVPREVEAELRRRAARAHTTPSLFVQTVLRQALAAESGRFSDAFAALAGSWEDERGADEIMADIERHRVSAARRPLR